MVLSYGFNYFWSPEYSIINVTQSQNKKVGEKILLSCQADDFWEWCRRVTLTLLFTRFCYNYSTQQFYMTRLKTDSFGQRPPKGIKRILLNLILKYCCEKTFLMFIEWDFQWISNIKTNRTSSSSLKHVMLQYFGFIPILLRA